MMTAFLPSSRPSLSFARPTRFSISHVHYSTTTQAMYNIIAVMTFVTFTHRVLQLLKGYQAQRRDTNLYPVISTIHLRNYLR